METWVPKLLESLDAKKVKTIKATGDMLLLPGSEEEEDHDHGEEGHHHEYDPHVWLSPARAIKLVEHIRDSLQLTIQIRRGLLSKMQQPISKNYKPWTRPILKDFLVQNKRVL